MDDFSASEPMEDPRGKHRERPFRTVLIVLAMAAAFGLASQAYMEWRARVVMEDVDRRAQEAYHASQLQAQQLQHEAQMREAKWQAQREQVEAQRIQAIQERQQAEEAGKRAVIDEAQRREKAWMKFYHKAAACNND